MHKHKNLAARLLVGVVLSACGGCAVSTPPLNPGEELAIVSEKRAEVAVVNTDIGKGATVGAAGGAAAGVAYGFLWAGLCGPFYAACLPGAIAISGGVGAAAGGIAGGTVGVIIGISPEKRDKLIANLAHVDAQQGVFGAIESRARARWKLVPAPAPNELIVRLDKVDLRASREKEVALAMTLAMLWKDKDDPRPILKSYEYLSPAAPLEDWIENRDGFIARTFERGYARIADDLIADLEGKSR